MLLAGGCDASGGVKEEERRKEGREGNERWLARMRVEGKDGKEG